jgi:hypothetical protein
MTRMVHSDGNEAPASFVRALREPSPRRRFRRSRRWVYDHMQVQGCPAVNIDVTERIVEKVDSDKVLAP